MATFYWKPALGASAIVKPRVEVAKFGDGYEQRVGTGIAHQLIGERIRIARGVGIDIGQLPVHPGITGTGGVHRLRRGCFRL